jgi:uncharacterized protein
MKKYIELKMDSLTMRGYENENNKSSCVVMFHGFTGNKTETNRMFYFIDQSLEMEGISSLRFDWFGHGESDLDLSLITVDLLLKQAHVILEYAKKKYSKIYLLGFSMGGALAINSLKYSIDRLILISPAVNMLEIARENYKMNKEIDYNLVDLHGLKLSKEFPESFKNLEYQENLINYNKPVLLIHGTNDLSVPIVNSEELYPQINKCSFVRLTGADHGYSKVEYLNRINQEIIDFLIKN